MNDILMINIIAFFGSTLISFSGLLLGKILYHIELKNIRTAVFLIALSTYSLVSNFFLQRWGLEVLKAVLAMIVIVLMFQMVFKLSILKSFIIMGFMSIIAGIGNGFCEIIFSSFNLSVAEVKRSPVFTLYSFLIILAFIGSALLLVHTFKLIPNVSEEIRLRAFSTSIVHILFVIMIIFGDIFYHLMDLPKNHPAHILNIVFIMGYFAFCLFQFNKNYLSEKNRKDLEYQINFNKTLEGLTYELKRSKHNHNNVLAVIYGYAAMKDLDGMKRYLSEVSQMEEKIQTLDQLLLMNIKDPGVLGMLSFKLQVAASKGINMKIDIDHEVSQIKMRNYELYEILGILIDNAIEAADESEDKSIKVTIKKMSRGFSFVIENSFDQLPDLERLYERNYTTKGKERGLGLYIVKNVIEKYKNVKLETKIVDRYFTQELQVS